MSFTPISDSTIDAVSPAGTDTIDVTVTTPAGTSATNPSDEFTYAADGDRRLAEHGCDWRGHASDDHGNGVRRRDGCHVWDGCRDIGQCRVPILDQRDVARWHRHRGYNGDDSGRHLDNQQCRPVHLRHRRNWSVTQFWTRHRWHDRRYLGERFQRRDGRGLRCDGCHIIHHKLVRLDHGDISARNRDCERSR